MNDETRGALTFLLWLIIAALLCWAVVAAVIWAAIQLLLFMGSFIVPTIS